MTDDAVRNIDEELDAWRQARPGAYELARVLSLAARVEPALSRRARLLLPQVDASAEADLWASTLLASQTVQGFVFDPDCASVLRHRLAADWRLFSSARDLIAWEHRNAPWPVRAEEMINWLIASGDPELADRGEQVLLAAARQMVDATDRVAAARWVMRAFTRLPPSLSASPAGRAIHAGVGAQLDGRLEISGDVPADTLENWLPWLLAGARSRRTVRFAIGDGFLEIDASDPVRTTPDTISIPETRPLLIDVRWHDGLAPHSVRVSLQPDELTRVAVTSTSVEVRAIDGTRAEVRPAGVPSHPSGLDFSGIRARYRPFVGRETELTEIDDLLRGNTRVVGIVGPPGIGKTALLCALLDRLESRHARVVAHFLDGGPAAWRGPAFVEGSLAAQLLGYADNPSASSWNERLKDPNGAPVFAALDGVEGSIILDDSEPSSPGSLSSLRVVYTATEAASEPQSLATAQATIDLSERAESNRNVCAAYLALHREAIAARIGIPFQPRQRLKAYIYYNRSDAELAARVAKDLQSMSDVETWFDSRDLQVGESWQGQLERAIADSDFIVTLATRASMRSQATNFEMNRLMQAGKRLFCLTDDVRAARQSGSFSGVADSDFIDISPGTNWVAEMNRALETIARQPSATIDSQLLDRSAGHIGRLVAMIKWIHEQPDRRVSLDRMPPTLYEDFDKVWESAMAEDEREMSIVLGFLAVAKAPVSLSPLQSGMSADVSWLDLASRLVRQNLLVMFDSSAAKPDAGPRFALADESIRPAVLEKIDSGQVRRFNELLAEADDDEEYALLYRFDHLLDAGKVDAAVDAAGDVDLLTRMCEVIGVDNLVTQLSAIEIAASQRPDTDTDTETETGPAPPNSFAV